MNKAEQKISPKVAKWFKNTVKKSTPFEIKHTRGSSVFHLNEISNHQLIYLEAATTKKGFIYKIVDANIGFTPFDYIMYKNTEAYVIIVFPNIVCAIEIRKILNYKEKSLPIMEAINIADFTTKQQDL